MIRTANIEPEMKTARLSAPGPRAALVIATASRHRLAKFPARCRERANIVQVSSLSPPPPLYPSFALLRTRIYYGRWRRFCLPSAKYSPSPHGRGFFISSLRLRLRFGSFLRGEGIGSLHLRLQSFTLRCAPVHFFRLRFRSPMPGERRNDAGTYRNPSPRPPPAVISGRGSRLHALEFLLIRRHPAAARCAHDSLCLSRLCIQRLRRERRHRRFLQHSVGVNRPCAFSPGSDHAYYNKFAGESTSSRRAFFVLTPQLQWKG